MNVSLIAWHPSPYLLLVLTTLFWSGNFVLGRAVGAKGMKDASCGDLQD